MIPKIIHYCWFGKREMSQKVYSYIEGWKKKCPDYEFVVWNESNFDLNTNTYVAEASRSGQWAFVSDIVRLYALYNMGGIYLDTDVELIKNFDSLLNCQGFIGFEEKDRLSTAIMACEKGNAIMGELIQNYKDRHFIIEGKMDRTPNVFIVTDLFYKYGLKKNNMMQKVKGIEVYPSEYFSPKNQMSKTIKLTANTISIHHFVGSWENDEDKYKHEVFLYFYKHKIPFSFSKILAKVVSVLKYRGISGISEEIKKRIKR